MKKRIVVTGSRGFIGSEVFFRLQMLGFHPIGIDLKDGRDVLDGVPDNDVTVHCASKLSGRGLLEYNKLLMQAVLPQTKRIIFLSSAAVYGNVKGATVKDTKPSPINEYGLSKLDSENMIRMSGKKYTIFRLSNVYGLHAPHGVISRFLKGKRVIYGDGKQVRDFIGVEDVADVIVDSFFNLRLWKGTLNLSSGEGTKIIDLFHRFYSDEEPEYRPVKKEIRYSILEPYSWNWLRR